MNEETPERLRRLVREGADEDIRALAPALHYHRLAPLVARRLPPDEREVLASAATRAAAVDLASFAALREATQYLDEAGLDFLVFKGTALGAMVYESPELRPREDIDILLPGWTEVRRAEQILERRGWRAALRLPGRFAAHAAVLTRRGKPSIDLHARINQRHRVAAAFPWNAVFERAVHISLPAIGDVRTLHPRDAFLLGALHASAHHGDQVAPLIWWEDLSRLAAGLDEDDWDGMVEVCERHELSTAFEAALRMLAWWDPSAVPTAIYRLFADKPADASAVYVDRPRAATAFLDDLLVLEADEARELLQELLFPPADYMHRALGVARERPLPVLWAARMLALH